MPALKSCRDEATFFCHGLRPRNDRIPAVPAMIIVESVTIPVELETITI